MGYQIFHLLYKNLLLIIRNKFVTLLEIGWPILFSFIIYLLKLVLIATYYPKTSYLNAPYIISSTPSIGNTFKNCNATSRGGSIAISPNNTLTNNIANRLTSTNFNIKYFNNNDELQNYISNSNYGKLDFGPKICLAIVFNNLTNLNFDYSLRFNTSIYNFEVPDTIGPRTNFIIHQKSSNLYKYVSSGFLTLQKYINQQIIKYQSSKTYVTQSTKLSSMIVEAYLNDPFNNIKNYLCIFLVIPLIVAFLRMVYVIVKEKEDKIRQLLLMMGTSYSTFYFSWLIRFMISYLIISIASMAILKFLIFKNSDFILLVIWHYLFCLSLISQSFFLSSFFTNAKLSVIISMIFFIINFMVIFLMQNNSNATIVTQYISSISPHNAFSISSQILIDYQSNGIGVNWSNIWDIYNNYMFVISIYSSCGNILFFGLLFLYLDQVFPNQFGYKKSPCFCLTSNCCKKKIDFLQQTQTLNNKQQEQIPAQNNNYKKLQQQNKCIKFKSLCKKFGDFQAVKKISMNLYQNQISVLLGHNGAGKTTIFSILSGLLNPTSGTVSIYGNDIVQNLDDIRKILGVCPQQNILFDQLTVRQHLNLYYSLKNLPYSQKKQKISQIISKLDLSQKADYFAKDLSGGQKRKLCLGNALIGDNKIILLDQPTAGMDTTARRHIWQILKIEKNQKIMILSTHFMDEADYLGDKIGIISKGQLKCIGNSIQLKNKYGRGYSLGILKQSSETDTNKIIDFIKQQKCLQVQLNTNISNQLTLKIKSNSILEFAKFLQKFYLKKSQFKIRSFGVSCTTLEQIFLNFVDHQPQANKYSQIQLQQIHSPNQQQLKQNKQKNTLQLQTSPPNPIKIIFALIVRKLHILKRDIKQLVCQLFLPTIILLAGVLVMTINFNMPSPSIILNQSLYPEGQIIYYGANTSNLASLTNSLNYLTIKQINTSSNNINSWDQQIFSKKNYYVKGGGWINDLKSNSYNNSYFIQCNTVSQDSCPFIMNKIDEAVLKNASNNQNAKITIRNAPLPQPKYIQSLEATAQGFIACLIFSVAISFITSSIASNLIQQRNIGCKQHLLVVGTSLSKFWLSTFIFDIIKYILPCFAGPIFCYVFEISGLVDEVFYVTIILFILNGLSTIPFTYILTFLFSDPGNGQVIIFFINLVFGICPIIFLILRIFAVDQVKNIIIFITYFIRIFPPFTFGYGIINITNRQIWALLNKTNIQSPLSSNVALWDVVYLGIMSIGCWVIIGIIEKLIRIKILICKRQQLNQNSILLQQDEQVIKQKQKVKKIIQNGQNLQSYPVLIQSVRKIYQSNNRTKIAVDSLSFSIEKGEIVGLLGVNGAGKSTTFKMLTGQQIQTDGDIYMAGYNLPNQISQAHKKMGYCPQTDSLYGNLTARQHIELYSRIKGQVDDLNLLVYKYLHLVGLQQYQNVCSKDYSGGNKRKLCVALAIIGNPQIILLDQPSAGMDPKTRRTMWNTISDLSKNKKKPSILLTTHLMQQAQALSTRLGIMIEGRLRCLGSIQQLKLKYGKGYQVQIKLKDVSNSLIKGLGDKVELGDNISYQSVKTVMKFLELNDLYEDIIESQLGKKIKSQDVNKYVLVEYTLNYKNITKLNQFIYQTFKNSVLIQTYGSYAKYSVDEKQIHKIFLILQQNKQKLLINFFNVKQSSLQQIFHNFATEYYRKIQKENLQQV